MFHQIISIKHDLNVLLLIDPQIDFCHKEGALYVPNAENDCKRIARFIREKKHDIDEIFVTLDSHHKKHIAHGAFWSDSPTGTGNMPGPFTVINNEENARLVSIDEKTGEKTQWYPRDLKFTNYGFEYTHNLQKKGRPLIIWPDHCLVSNIYSFLALNEVEMAAGESIIGSGSSSSSTSSSKSSSCRDIFPSTTCFSCCLCIAFYNTILHVLSAAIDRNVRTWCCGCYSRSST